MPTVWKRMTFVVTPEMEAPLRDAKRDLFYNRTQSEMIRALIAAGLRAIQLEKAGKGKDQAS